MRDWPRSLIEFLAWVDTYFAELVDCLCDGPEPGPGCEFHNYMAESRRIPLDLWNEVGAVQNKADAG